MTVTAQVYEKRRQRLFLILSGMFLGTLAMLNILGISRFLDLSFEVFGFNIPMVVAIGVLPYPVTFICTDLISELYGEKKARDMVWMGVLLNAWVIFLLWLGGVLPGFDLDANGQPLLDAAGREPTFFEIRELAFGAVAASMVAYLAAQLCDVRLFHFWKNWTGGRKLWLRNNLSTIPSQFVDTFAVLFLMCTVGEIEWALFGTLLLNGFIFKVLIAALDTPLVYLGSWLIRRRFDLKLGEEMEI